MNALPTPMGLNRFHLNESFAQVPLDDLSLSESEQDAVTGVGEADSSALTGGRRECQRWREIGCCSSRLHRSSRVNLGDFLITALLDLFFTVL